MFKVKNFTLNNGNSIPNQFEIYGNIELTIQPKVGGEFKTIKAKHIFQSYEKIIVVKTTDKIYLDKFYWDYSRTTGKYRNMFLNEYKADTKAKIESGEYKLVDLNR